MWPVLFLTPHGQASSANLHALWPTIHKSLEQRHALLQTSTVLHVPPRPVPELQQTEHCFWLLQLDERVVVAVAVAGHRNANDEKVTALLNRLAQGLRPDKLIELSLYEQHHLHRAADADGFVSWWKAVLRRVAGQGSRAVGR